ncbi:MAG TPA: hypothetical protein PKE45_21010 [Caldilineaceae bacterium]|nr:hypothetical protein [Caldilineaceae bacterium]
MQENGEASPIWLIVAIVVGFLVIFPLFWCFVVWVISLIGGWRRLAQVYRTSETPSGPRLFAYFVLVGIASYRNTVALTATPAGLHLAIMPLFRVGHPPLLIPWSALRGGGPASFRWLPAVRFEGLGAGRNLSLTTLFFPVAGAERLPVARKSPPTFSA